MLCQGTPQIMRGGIFIFSHDGLSGANLARLQLTVRIQVFQPPLQIIPFSL